LTTLKSRKRFDFIAFNARFFERDIRPVILLQRKPDKNQEKFFIYL